MLAVVLLSACATTGALGIDPQPSSRGRVDLVPPAAEETAQVIPQAIAPQLPSADRLARTIDARLGERASVDVRLCVTPAGKLASAKLERSSSLASFDDAVLADVAKWQFAAQPGPATLQTCEITTIVYRPHR
ncbi:MAG TPA: energy transducer TonB [Kofleriaceae bacterium]